MITLLDSAEEGTVIFQNFGNYPPSASMSHSGVFESLDLKFMSSSLGPVEYFHILSS